MRMVSHAIVLLAACALVASLAASGARAQNAAAPDKGAAAFVSAPPGATACLGCHGQTPTALPSLSRLKADDITAAMQGFRDGTREATLMNRIAKGFTPEETRAIADWLAKQGGRTP